MSASSISRQGSLQTDDCLECTAVISHRGQLAFKVDVTVHFRESPVPVLPDRKELLRREDTGQAVPGGVGGRFA